MTTFAASPATEPDDDPREPAHAAAAYRPSGAARQRPTRRVGPHCVARRRGTPLRAATRTPSKLAVPGSQPGARFVAGDVDTPTGHRGLVAWVREVTDLCEPAAVHWCDGSQAEYEQLCRTLVGRGHLRRARRDTAGPAPSGRAPTRATSPASRTEPSSAPSTIGRRPDEPLDGPGRDARQAPRPLRGLACTAARCTSSRSAWARSGRRLSYIGVEITDSPYVAASMIVMTRAGKGALDVLGDDGDFVPCLHSLGAPLADGEADAVWPCNPDEKWIVHFPETREIWSYGSGYGGNALLGKKCLALRIASRDRPRRGLARRAHAHLEAHVAERRHLLRRGGVPLGVREDEPRAHRPDDPGLEGGVRRRRHRLDEVRRRRAALRDQPGERASSGWRPGRTGQRTRTPCAPSSATRCSPTRRSPTTVTSGGRAWTASRRPTSPTGTAPTGHRARTRPPRTPTRGSACPSTSARSWRPSTTTRPACRSRRSCSAAGAPSTVPLVFESRDWAHGVFVAATMGSEKTAAAFGNLGELRRDPFAMLPFCGYHMGDYFAHWLSMPERSDERKLPRIYGVNWFRKDEDGHFLWPGYGENSRVLDWICRRLDGDADARRHADRRGAPPRGPRPRRARRRDP